MMHLPCIIIPGNGKERKCMANLFTDGDAIHDKWLLDCKAIQYTRNCIDTGNFNLNVAAFNIIFIVCTAFILYFCRRHDNVFIFTFILPT